MTTKKKLAPGSNTTKPSAKVRDLKPKKDIKGGTEVRRYDIVGAFPKSVK